MLDNLYCNPACPFSLYKSLQGKYFIGTSSVEFGNGKYGWAGLFNPPGSRTLLFLNVFTVTNITDTPFSSQAWLNVKVSGKPKITRTQSPANTAICPLPVPKMCFLYSENVSSLPSEGTLIFGRRCSAQSTVVSENDGKFICPPGGSFLINLLPPETSNEKIFANIAFGWWEEPCMY